MIAIRPHRPEDTLQIAAIFHQAVQVGAEMHYSKVQRDAWSPCVQSEETWSKRLVGLTTLVAEAGDKVVGFMSLRADGYLDFTYVLPAVMGQGIADSLYEQIERVAQGCGFAHMTANASHVAKSFCIRKGWSVVRSQVIERHGVSLENWVMFKSTCSPKGSQQ